MIHGRRGTYVKGCRCEPCRQANTRYAKWRDIHGAQLVDATRARDHVAALRTAGVGRREIARRSGVSLTVVTRLAGVDQSRPALRVRPSTEAAILAVRPDRVAPGSVIPSLGTSRRLQALVALGWTQTELASRIGWTVNNLGSLVHGREGSVTQRTADQVTDLFDQLSGTPGPSTRARNLAARHGWVPPLAWDDPDTDPAPIPDTRTRSGIHPDDVAELRAQGYTTEAIAYRLGVTSSHLLSVESRARRAS